MHLLLTIAVIVFCSCVSIHAQDNTAIPGSRHILLVNKTHETKKVVNTGDKVRLILKTSKKVKGHIKSIDSTFLTVDNNVVHLNEIEKISTKKIWQQLLGVPFVAFGGLWTIAGLANIGDIADDEFVGAALLLGIPITAVGVGIMSPGYHRIGKSRFLLISSKPNDSDKAFPHTTLR